MKSLKKKRLLAWVLDYIVISLIVSLITCLSFINPNYDDYVKYSEKYVSDYTTYIKDTTEENLDNMIMDNYYVAKYGIIYSIVEAAIIVSYLGIFAWQQDGQTLGKKWQKIKVVSTGKKELSLNQSVARSIILYNIIFTLINLVTVSLFDVKVFQNVSYITNSLSFLISFIILLTIFIRKDMIGLHDKICKTKVIEVRKEVN